MNLSKSHAAKSYYHIYIPNPTIHSFCITKSIHSDIHIGMSIVRTVYQMRGMNDLKYLL